MHLESESNPFKESFLSSLQSNPHSVTKNFPGLMVTNSMIWHQLQLLIIGQGKNFALRIPQTKAVPAKITARKKFKKSFVCTVDGKFY